jgi:hypothetical protein
LELKRFRLDIIGFKKWGFKKIARQPVAAMAGGGGVQA